MTHLVVEVKFSLLRLATISFIKYDKAADPSLSLLVFLPVCLNVFTDLYSVCTWCVKCLHVTCSGVCVSGSWLEHCGQRARAQCWRGDAWFIRAHCHRHHHQSGPAVDGTADPRLLPGLWTEWDHWHHNHDPASVTGWPIWHARPQLFLGVWIHSSKYRHPRPSTGPSPPVQNPQPPYTRRVCEWRWRCWCVSKCVCLNGLFVDSCMCSAGISLTWALKKIWSNCTLCC